MTRIVHRDTKPENLMNAPATANPHHARSIGTATIAFGLVSVPVKLYSSSETVDEVSFHMHHDADGARLKQQYVCTKCNEVVDKDHTLKGYEHAKGQHVLFTGAELDALDAVATNTIAIEEFVAPTQVDPTYVEKTYYLGPDKGSERAFVLLVEAMEELRKVAIATYARKGKERLVCVRSRDGRLFLHELRFASEVKALEAVPRVELTSKPPELRLAKEIIGRMASEAFTPDKYRDTVQERVRQLIQGKVDGGEITVAPIEQGGVVDLIDALKASLDVAPARSHAAPPKRDRKQRVAAAVARGPKSKRPAARRAGARA